MIPNRRVRVLPPAWSDRTYVVTNQVPPRHVRASSLPPSLERRPTRVTPDVILSPYQQMMHYDMAVQVLGQIDSFNLSQSREKVQSESLKIILK